MRDFFADNPQTACCVDEIPVDVCLRETASFEPLFVKVGRIVWSVETFEEKQWSVCSTNKVLFHLSVGIAATEPIRIIFKQVRRLLQRIKSANFHFGH